MSIITKQVKTFAISLRAKNYSDRTISCYVSILRSFLSHFKISPNRITSDEITEWIASHDNGSTKAQIQGCLKNYYTHVVGQPRKFDYIPSTKRELKLPKVIDRDRLVLRIDRIRNIKHRAMVSVLYGLGLRRSELLDLLVSDIDGTRKTVHVRSGKGKKDRILQVSDSLLDLLRNYYRTYRPSTYLFEGASGGRYSPNSLAKICKTHIGINPHGLRHCNATHLIEAGMDVSEVSKRLGHSKLQTTMIYNHISTTHSQISLV